MKSLLVFLKQEDGASLAEYGILVALIAAVAITAVSNLGTQVTAVFTDIVNKITT